ncbi:MAG: AmmeMemoRadiSam system protein B [Spirochaetes bacterium]|nr:AmmeMemoRadiSam system protein B [Spirochaetota bacterium]
MYVRKAEYAGSFYPDIKEDLIKSIENSFSRVKKTEISKRVMGIISPHAGYVYSGITAAHGYSVLDTETETVLILAPSHKAYFNCGNFIAPATYETPLGSVNTEDSFTEYLKGSSLFSEIQRIDELEHSHEVQIPFLQYVLKDFTVFPVILGTNNMKTLKDIAEKLYEAVSKSQKKITVVMSADLSHFHTYDKAEKIDSLFIKCAEEFDECELDKQLSSEKIESCGHASIVCGFILLKLMGAQKLISLNYMNSGDRTGDKSRVVGYYSAAVI